MGILVSGMTETQCRDFVGNELWHRRAIQWIAPAALATAATGHLVIWFYRAPWSLDTGRPGEGAPATREALAHWLEQNRSILNMRRQLGSNLLLVNPARVAPGALRARLDQNEPPDTSATTSTSSAETVHARLLGQLFERSAPHYWDVFESLEAASWLPSGEPLFRGTAVASEEQLFSLLDVLGDHSRLGGEIAQLHETIGGHASSIRQSDQETQELRQEGELLLLQLHQVQEELEQYYLKNIDLEKAAATSKKALVEAQKAVATSQGNAKALQLQLRQMQDELKRRQVVSAPPVPISIDSLPTTRPRGTMHWLRVLARKVLGPTADKRILRDQLNAIRNSEWFDPQWYLDQYPDVRAAGVDPVEHYFNNGWKENRNPGAGFDTAYYLRSNPDVANSSFNPLWHFIEFGRKEQRLPRKS